MRKVLACAALCAAMAGFTAMTPSSAIAQGKKEKDAKKAMKATGVVLVKEGKDGKFYFSVRDEDDKYLAGSGAFATEKEAMKGIEDLKDVLKNAKVMKGEKAKGKEKKAGDKDKK